MPIIERPAVSNVIVAITGRPVVLAAAVAASTSSRADMVSIHKTSAPPSARASACSVKAAIALSRSRAPRGTNNSPVGPIEPATITLRPALSAMSLASIAAALLSSYTRVSD